MPQLIMKSRTNNSYSCIPCTTTKQFTQMSPMPNPNCKHIMKDFSVQNYNENTPLLKNFLKDKNIEELNGKICKNCDSKLQRHTIVTCSMCGKTMKCYTALVLDNNGIKTYKCKPCNSTLQEQKNVLHVEHITHTKEQLNSDLINMT